MSENTYHIELKKYLRLYLVFPPLLAFIMYGGEMFSWEAGGFMVAVVMALHLLYYWRVYPHFTVVVADTGLRLFDLFGQKQEIAWDDLVGPLERDFYVVKYYTFVSAENPEKRLIITNYTEKTDACLAEIQTRMQASSSR